MAGPELIKKLRDMTQAGVMDCKKALEANENDVEKAATWLREKGIAKAAKKADAVAAEGVVLITHNKDTAAIFEVNCQTDFVAKNEGFIKLANEIGQLLISKKPKTLEEAVQLKLSSGHSIESECVNLTAKIGEKITLRRFEIINKKDSESFGLYCHSNQRVGTLLLFEGNADEEVGKNIAMHATAMAPKFLNTKSVDKAWLDQEKKVALEQMGNDPKFANMPADRKEKVLEGKMRKTVAEVCLEDQAYVKEPSLTVAEYAKRNKITISKMVRYEVGEGIEKVVSDFAKEVAEQMKQ